MSATRFVIVSFGRTGSTWLTLLLRSHPGVLCHGEIFNLAGIKYAPGYPEQSVTARAWPMAFRDRDPRGFLEAMLAEDLGHQAVGVKMLNWHHPELISELARREDVHKVVVRRRNRVRAFLSTTRAKAISRWIVENYDGMRVRLDPTELVDYAERYETFYEELRLAATGTPVREVVYEDLVDDPQYARDIIQFLGVTPSDIPLRSTLPRQSNDLTRTAVSNFDELSAFLHGTALHTELEA